MLLILIFGLVIELEMAGSWHPSLLSKLNLQFLALVEERAGELGLIGWRLLSFPPLL
jgi:hypothetical protein